MADLCQGRIRGEEMIRDFAYCNLWKPHLTREEALRWFEPLMARGWQSRPCTSPRRNQCRLGNWGTYTWCESLPWYLMTTFPDNAPARAKGVEPSRGRRV